MSDIEPAFSVQREIQRLAPAELEPSPPPDTLVPLSELWDQVTKNLARLGKQQFRANQTIEFVEQQARNAEEQAETYRRENILLREKAEDSAKKLLSIIDALDDVAVMARQRGDPTWISHIERLTDKTLKVYGTVGLSEVSASGEAFNPEEHEVLDVVAPAPGQDSHQIVEVIHRGFRYNGQVLRRAQTITTR